ncbi:MULTISPECIES: HGxxPAAW family protein [Micrococcaceae]|uniref:HGxxPAAW family protein n=1 Tax=unclassified Kocuria TaxID=2649579 RepID=UPI001010E032|nr:MULTISPECIES: HGxxPAAW family protein [unclassified Kocuria]
MSSEQQLELTPIAVEGHGNTISAWALVVLVVVGLTVGCVAFVVGNTPWVIVGLAIIVVGFIVSGVLKAAGFGKLGSRTKSHK